MVPGNTRHICRLCVLAGAEPNFTLHVPERTWYQSL